MNRLRLLSLGQDVHGNVWSQTSYMGIDLQDSGIGWCLVKANGL